MRTGATHQRGAFLLSVLLAGPTSVGAQETVADTSAVDSVQSRIIAGFGERAFLGGRTLALRERWQWLPVRSIAQAVDDHAGRYVRLVGEAGADVGTSWLGGGTAHDRWSIDGLSTDDPLTGRASLTMLPLEHLASIEQLSDEEATLTGHRWNLVSRQFSTVRPLTAIRFVQEPDETILTDAFFSQNVARATSLTFGFQRHTTAGRYSNAALDAWDLRGRVRANLSDRWNVAASWTYARWSRGVNGGVEPALSRSIFDDVTAIVVHASTYEIREQSGLGLSAVIQPFGDSLATTRLGIQRRSSEREYHQLPDRFSSIQLRHFARAQEVEVFAEQRIQLPFLSAAAAAQIASTQIDSTEVFADRSVPRSRWSAGAALTILDWLTPRAAVALVTDDGTEAFESAVSVTLAPISGWHATISAQMRPVFPTLQERFWMDSTVLRPATMGRGEERSLRAEVSWSLDSTIDLRVSGFRREQRDVVVVRPDLTTNGTPSVAVTLWSPTWSGMTADARLSLFGFELSGAFTWAAVDVDDSLKQVLPQWWGNAELAYQGRVFRDQLGVRTGIRARFSDRLRGLSPDPPTGLEVANTTMQIGRAVTVDLYGTMEIGQALLTLSWENLANARTLRAALYPLPGRQVKLGVRWAFAD